MVYLKNVDLFIQIKQGAILFFQIINCDAISIGNYTVGEVLMKNRTRVWRNIWVRSTSDIIKISPNTSVIFN
jgi:hypothetical protein